MRIQILIAMLCFMAFIQEILAKKPVHKIEVNDETLYEKCKYAIFLSIGMRIFCYVMETEEEPNIGTLLMAVFGVYIYFILFSPLI